jgi:predicted RNase H-like HicB family nuclease
MKSLSDYTIILRPDNNGTFVARIPAIKGCHAWGETPEQAREELNNVFAMICEEYSVFDIHLGQNRNGK